MSLQRSNPLPTVLLRHELPDGTHHYDWLLAQDAQLSLPLITWRCPSRIDTLQPGESLRIERLPDHRQMYLQYEGQVSGDRGFVQRERAGVVWNSQSSPTEAHEIELQWQNLGAKCTQRLSLTPKPADNWSVTCVDRCDEP